MTRETRANLIFITLFLCISVPGAVILFKKKLDPTAAPMYLPDPVRKRLPYIVPQATADEVTRSIPEQTERWVEQVAREQGGVAHVPMYERKPVISDDRRVQVVGVRDSKVFLIAWSGGFGTELTNYVVTLSRGGGKVTAARQLPLPQGVVKELMNAGYAMPPTSVTWVEVSLESTDKTAPLAVTLSYADGATRASSSVNVFTDPPSSRD